MEPEEIDNPQKTVKEKPGKRIKVKKTHVVKRGDSLYSLSKKYGTTVDALKKVNRLKKFFEDSARHLGDASIATPAHLEVGAVLAPQEGPGAYIPPEERRRVTRSQKKKKTTSASWF
jgi:nucleoid-associated protein YgaU